MSRTTIPLPFDNLDYQIIRCLNEDARMSAVDLEKVTKANQRTIRKRIQRLIDMGALRLRAVVEPKVFGFGISVDIFVTLDGADEADVIEKLGEMPPVTYIATGQNAEELSLECRFQDMEAMEAFFKHDLTSLEGVKVKGYALVPRIVKNIDDWLPPAEIFRD